MKTSLLVILAIFLTSCATALEQRADDSTGQAEQPANSEQPAQPEQPAESASNTPIRVFTGDFMLGFAKDDLPESPDFYQGDVLIIFLKRVLSLRSRRTAHYAIIKNPIISENSRGQKIARFNIPQANNALILAIEVNRTTGRIKAIHEEKDGCQLYDYVDIKFMPYRGRGGHEIRYSRDGTYVGRLFVVSPLFKYPNDENKCEEASTATGDFHGEWYYRRRGRWFKQED